MKTILEVFSDEVLMEYARTRQVPQNFIGPVLFPDKPTNSLDFKYIKGTQRSPVMANVQTFGAEASIAQREFGYSYVEGSIPPIKRKIVINEEDLIRYRSPRLNTDDQEQAIDSIYNDVDNMLDSVQHRVEWMRMQALATGKVTIDELGVKLEVDYGYNASTQTVTLNGTALWSDHTNSNPIDNIREWCDTVETNTGVRPARILTTTATMGHILLNAKVRLMVWGDQGSIKPVTWTDIQNLFAAYKIPPIVTYDVSVRSESRAGVISTTRLLADGKFILLPPNALGETLWGPTAEALDSDSIDARRAPGIIAQVYRTKEPPAHWTKAAAVALPTFPNADLVYVATVL